MPAMLQQVAALPYRARADGGVEVLLITSRATRRWVVPKGNRIAGLTAHEAAAQEAWEEAGAIGIPCPAPLGRYRYTKRRRRGDTAAEATLYPLLVTERLSEWPERHQRDTRWFGLAEAAAAVDERDLAAMIAGFRAPPVQPAAARVFAPWPKSLTGKVPMLRWFQALMPKQGRFFDQFEAHAATLVAGAESLALLLKGGPEMAQHIAAIRDREHEADTITCEVLRDVRRVFVTPFDRSAITGLIGVMDDAIDQMNGTATSIALYEVSEFDPRMRDMSGLIVEAARVTAETVPLLRALGPNQSRLHQLTERLVHLEGHADELHEQGLRALFQAHKAGGDPMDFIVGRELYGHLEKIVDRFEDVANEIQGLVIDHA